MMPIVVILLLVVGLSSLPSAFTLGSVHSPLPPAAAAAAAARNHDVSIDAVTVLLPAHVHTDYRTYVVYYPVTAHGGCFQWRTSNSALVNLQPIPASRCTERVAQKNDETGEMEWSLKEGYTSVYVSAATSVSPMSEGDEVVGGQAGAPFTSNKTFQRRLAAWISAHDITREEKFAEW